VSACDIRFDESLDRTDPRRARAIGASQTTTGASARRAEGQARAHERRVQRAADAYAALHAHATRVKRARGEYIGGAAPYGFTLAADGSLVSVEHEHLAIVRMVELRQCGYSLRIIAGQLADDGHETRNGAPWHPQQVARVLAAHDARVEYQRACDLMGLAHEADTATVTPF